MHERAPERTRRPEDPFPADRIYHRIPPVADKRLNELGERIQSGIRRNRGGHRVGQLGIDDRRAGEHVRAAQAHFDAMLGRGEHRIARHLRAGAGSRRNCDVRRRRHGDRLASPNDFQIVKQVAFVRHDGSNRLARVEGAPSSEADDHVAPGFAGLPDTLQDGRHFRLACTTEGRGSSPLPRSCSRNEGSVHEIPCRDDHRPTAHRGGERSRLCHPSRAEQYARGCGEFELHVTTPNPDRQGKRLMYFMPVRGSAIMPATVSRHVW